MQQPQKNKDSSIPRKKLLLVEDDKEIGNWLLKRLGTTIDESNFTWKLNLKDAAAELEKNPVDIVILDLKLPDGNGVDLIKKIRKQKMPADVYVFSVNAEFKNACLRLGANEFFDKTKDGHRLAEKILDAL